MASTIKNIMTKVRERRNLVKGARAYNGPTYSLTQPVITSRTVTIHYPFSNFRLPETLPPGIESIEGRETLGSVAIRRVTRGHGIVGSSSGTVNHWYIKTSAGMVVIHRSGAIQVTSPNATGRVAKQLERLMPGVTSSFSSAKVVKFDAHMYVNRKFSFGKMGPALAKKIPFSTATWLYEPELMNRAKIVWKSPSMTLILYTSGQIQIFGALRPRDAVTVMKTVIDTIGPSSAFRDNSVGNATNKTKEQKNERLRLEKLNARHARVSGYNHVPEPGQYVRPGPNGVPRVYNIKPNMRLSHQKIITAYQKAGVNMPNYVKNIVYSSIPFGGGASSGAKRASGWNAKQNGFYVRPGPGKQPHFYKIPKDLKAGFKTANKAYREASINMPAHVRNIFGATALNENVILNRPRHSVQNNKVNGVSYKKLTTAQLLAIARNLNNAGASSKMTKNVLFARIKSKAPVKAASPVRAPNVSVNGRMYTFSNDPTNQRIIRDGRKRVFSTLPRAEREAVARAYLGNAKFANWVSKPSDWYNLMRVKKQS